MAEVIPFRGLRYNRQAVPDLSQVVSPPYDIISPAEQDHYHQKDPHNAIRLDFGLEKPGDDAANNRYTRAAAELKSWIDEGVLSPEAQPALYYLREEFTGPNGEPAVREGFIAAVRLAEFKEGIILPHEETASGPKEDRLKLMESTQANLSPIYCLYSDPELKIARALEQAQPLEPEASFEDEAGTRHTFKAVSDPDAVELVTNTLKEEKLLIADGHHRYETALTYRNQRRQEEEVSGREMEDANAGPRPYDYLMVYLANMAASSGSILPIHRLVCGLTRDTLTGITALLESDFDIDEVPSSAADPARVLIDHMAAAGGDRNAFGLYLPAAGTYYLLVGRRPRPMLDPSRMGKSPAWCGLDVSVLDRLVLGELLGIQEDGANGRARVKFVERTGNALRQAEDCDAAFFVNPTSMEEIRAVAEAGEKMPQKSTYFHPKPLTGLVFRSLGHP